MMPPFFQPIIPEDAQVIPAVAPHYPATAAWLNVSPATLYFGGTPFYIPAGPTMSAVAFVHCYLDEPLRTDQ